MGTALVGFADSTYLTVKHYQGAGPNCLVFEGCEQVTSSPYAEIAGVPLSLFGALYYLAVFLVLVAYLDTGRVKIFRLSAVLVGLGFLASAWFVYLQLFVIEAVCPYCMVSAAACTLLLALNLFAVKYT